MARRVLVCGGRDYTDWQRIYAVLDAAHATSPITCLIHGAARGADTIALNWAVDRNVPCEAYPADWDRHGYAAGPLRNRQMLEQGKPHMVMAFPGGFGTADTVRKAKAAGVTVVRIADAAR